MDREVYYPDGSPRAQEQDRMSDIPVSYTHREPKRNKWQTVARYVKNGTANFFGVGAEDYEKCERWQNRRMRMCSRKFMGDLKDDAVLVSAPAQDETDSGLPMVYDPLARPRHTSEMSSVFASMRDSRLSLTPRRPRRQRKESVFRMTWNGLKKRRAADPSSWGPQPTLHSRSFAPVSLSEDAVFDSIPPTPRTPLADGEKPPLYHQMSLASYESGRPQFLTQMSMLSDEVFFDLGPPLELGMGPPPLSPLEEAAEPRPSQMSMDEVDATARGLPVNWRRMPTRSAVGRPSTPGDQPPEPSVVRRRIPDKILDAIIDRSDRRRFGEGIVGRCFGRSFRKDISASVREQLDQIHDHRPFFTYWMTFCQLVIFVVSVSVYGFAPIGVHEKEISEPVLLPTLELVYDRHNEPQNLWIGPRQADLIHLGAKYSPCMRQDDNINRNIIHRQKIERGSACCVRNDGSGCYQTTASECSTTLATHIKWSAGSPGYQGKESGSVCGQDPEVCLNPPSSGAFEWKDDITKWPICQKSGNSTKKHMTCSITGRPCCVGIQGDCIITTREVCDFRRGYFHDEATLCSQVKCMNEICGMISFANKEKPDQFYRLWTALFLHAGVVHILFTLVLQWFIMRDLEKLIGWLRITIIYLGSGIAGNLASAIFLPYLVEVGPSGAQFGLLGCLVVEVIQSWRILKNPGAALGKLLAILVVGILLGFLPWIDNYAHVLGFLVGFLLSFAFLPYVNFGQKSRQIRIAGIVVSLVVCTALFAGLVIFFYVAPIYNCGWCQYFTCIPFNEYICKNQQVKIAQIAQ